MPTPSKTSDEEAVSAATETPCPHRCVDGFYTVSIPIARAMVSDRRACPIHGPVHRRLVRDSATDRVGEIRGYLTKAEGEAVWLRPRGGGKEWTALVADLGPAPDDQAAEADAPPLENHGEYQCPYCSGDSLEAQIAREVYGCTAGTHCVEVTPAQRTTYNARIMAALAERRQEAEAVA